MAKAASRSQVSFDQTSDYFVVSTSPFLLDKENKERLELIGKTSLKNGRWGVLIFSGGAATRFFSDSALKDKVKSLKGPIPKGLFPLTPVLGLPFLDFFAAQMLEIGIETGTLPPLILMVSSETADAIKAWRPHYPAEALIIIEQARHPRLDEDGDLVAHPDGRLVQTGDGHGGVFKALQQPRAGGDGGRDRDRVLKASPCGAGSLSQETVLWTSFVDGC